MVVTNNNESKNIFRSFLDNFGLDREKGSMRQVVDLPNGIKYCFSTTFDSDDAECRQTYEDSKGFITFHEVTGKYFIGNEGNITKYPYTRTMKNGVKAHSVKMRLKDMKEITCKEDIIKYAESFT